MMLIKNFHAIGFAQSDLQAFHIMPQAIIMYREAQKNFSTLFQMSFNPFFPFHRLNRLVTFTAGITNPRARPKQDCDA